MTKESIRALACNVMMQAVKDYVSGTAAERKVILKDLRSSWMQWFSDGTSLVVAEQLEKHHKEIRKRLRAHDSGVL